MIIGLRKSVFVSFASEDQHIATEVVARLRAEGLDPFFAPNDIQPSSPWQADIYYNLRSASALLAIFTPRAISNAWVVAECSSAWILGIPVYSLAMFTPLSQLPAFASTLQARCIETAPQLDAAIKDISKHLSQNTLRTASWTHIANAMSTIDQRLRDDFIPTDVVVGSGGGGAICGAILASRRGIPLKVCDVKKGTQKSADLSSLSETVVKGRNVLARLFPFYAA